MDSLPYEFMNSTLLCLPLNYKVSLLALPGLWGEIGCEQEKHKVVLTVHIHPKQGKMAVQTLPFKDLSGYSRSEHCKFITRREITIDSVRVPGLRTYNFAQLGTMLCHPRHTASAQTLSITDVHRRTTRADIEPVLNTLGGNFKEVNIVNVKFYSNELNSFMRRILQFKAPELQLLNSDITPETMSLIASSIQYFDGRKVIITGCSHRFHLDHIQQIFETWTSTSFQVLIRCDFPYRISLSHIRRRLGIDRADATANCSVFLRSRYSFSTFQDGDLCIQLSRHLKV